MTFANGNNHDHFSAPLHVLAEEFDGDPFLYKVPCHPIVRLNLALASNRGGTSPSQKGTTRGTRDPRARTHQSPTTCPESGSMLIQPFPQKSEPVTTPHLEVVDKPRECRCPPFQLLTNSDDVRCWCHQNSYAFRTVRASCDARTSRFCSRCYYAFRAEGCGPSCKLTMTAHRDPPRTSRGKGRQERLSAEHRQKKGDILTWRRSSRMMTSWCVAGL